MIATVKIAPMQYWCLVPYNAHPKAPMLPGLPVEIIKMMPDPSPECGGRCWEMTRASAIALWNQLNPDRLGECPSGAPYICEHMLEMD